MLHCKGTFYILVVEDTGTKELIGCATLLVEQKFIHSAGTVSQRQTPILVAEKRGIWSIINKGQWSV